MNRKGGIMTGWMLLVTGILAAVVLFLALALIFKINIFGSLKAVIPNVWDRDNDVEINGGGLKVEGFEAMRYSILGKGMEYHDGEGWKELKGREDIIINNKQISDNVIGLALEEHYYDDSLREPIFIDVETADIIKGVSDVYNEAIKFVAVPARIIREKEKYRGIEVELHRKSGQDADKVWGVFYVDPVDGILSKNELKVGYCVKSPCYDRGVFTEPEDSYDRMNPSHRAIVDGVIKWRDSVADVPLKITYNVVDENGEVTDTVRDECFEMVLQSNSQFLGVDFTRVVECLERGIVNSGVGGGGGESEEIVNEETGSVDYSYFLSDSGKIYARELILGGGELNPEILNEMILQARKREGKYRDNKAFIDSIFAQRIFTEKEYEDITGVGWFNLQGDMNDVRILLNGKKKVVDEQFDMIPIQILGGRLSAEQSSNAPTPSSIFVGELENNRIIKIDDSVLESGSGFDGGMLNHLRQLNGRDIVDLYGKSFSEIPSDLLKAQVGSIGG